ncbi:hypothetical protein DVS77_15810 [Mycolicibacterium moriokaense]|nr:hypothetical protein DVS77_15810 [Mycolicibacterium moriokaense]
MRGTAAGMLTAALAVAAHGAADGAAPSGSTLVLLAVLGATVGGLAATISRAADARVLLLLLATGQVVGHLMLSATGHHHDGPTSPAHAMLLAHAAAVVVGALLIAAGDRLCRVISRVALASAPTPVAPIPSSPVVAADADQPLRSALLLAASMSHRGPPVCHAR